MVPDVSMLTDVDGKYAFIDLQPGTYTVAEQNQTGFVQTFPGIGSSFVHSVRVTGGNGRNS